MEQTKFDLDDPLKNYGFILVLNLHARGVISSISNFSYSHEDSQKLAHTNSWTNEEVILSIGEIIVLNIQPGGVARIRKCVVICLFITDFYCHLQRRTYYRPEHEPLALLQTSLLNSGSATALLVICPRAHHHNTV